MIKIWEPRWKDRTVLIDTKKVRAGRNLLTFTQGTLKGQVYSFNADDVYDCETQKLGKTYKITCYVVPMNKLHFEYDKTDKRIRDNTRDTAQMVWEEMRW